MYFTIIVCFIITIPLFKKNTNTIYTFFSCFRYSYLNCGREYIINPCNRDYQCSSKKCVIIG